MDYPFISLIQHPGVVLIGRDKIWNEIINEMVMAILNVWPLVLLNVLIIVVAGFIVWLLVYFHYLLIMQDFHCFLFSVFSLSLRKRWHLYKMVDSMYNIMYN